MHSERAFNPFKPAKQEEVEDEILKLREYQYIARYGDYLKIIPARLGLHARQNQLEDWNLLSGKHQWTTIAKRIMEEEDARREASRSGSKLEDLETRTINAVFLACNDLGICEKTAIWSIKEYALRNNEVHRDLDKIKESGNFPLLAKTLFADREDLNSIFSYKSETNIQHLKNIIQEEIDVSFRNADDFPDDPHPWLASEAVEALHKEAKARANQPTHDRTKEANIAAAEKKSRAKAARQKEASSGSSSAAGKKRVASTAEPRESEREGQTKGVKTQSECIVQAIRLRDDLKNACIHVWQRGQEENS